MACGMNMKVAFLEGINSLRKMNTYRDNVCSAVRHVMPKDNMTDFNTRAREIAFPF